MSAQPESAGCSHEPAGGLSGGIAPVKILFTTQVSLDRADGSARHVAALASAWTRLRHEVTLVAPGTAAAANAVKRMRPHGSQAPGLRLERAVARAAVRALRDGHPDIAYVRLSASSSLVPWALSTRGVPVVLELNGPILDELRRRGRSRPSVAAVRRMLRSVVARARVLVAVAPPFAAHARAELRAQRIRVVENGTDLEIAIPGDRHEARRALGLPTEGRYVAYVGSRAPEQRIDWLVQACRALPELRLLIAGEEPPGGRDETTPFDPERILRFGPVPHEQAIRIVQAADVCADVREQNLGLKSWEYAAVGRRIVCFDGSGLERLQRAYAGQAIAFAAEERSAEALGKALETALEHEAAQGPLPDAAIERARRELGWDHTASRLVEIFEEELRCG